MLEGHWGFNTIPKYNEEYFIEDGRELDSLCPFSKPTWCKCPHCTDGEPIKLLPKSGIYINESSVEFKIPNQIQHNCRVYYYSGVMTAREIIKNKEMLITNYIPLIIRGFNVDGKQNRFLDLLLPEVDRIGRSIILETGGIRVPVPGFVTRIK